MDKTKFDSLLYPVNNDEKPGEISKVCLKAFQRSLTNNKENTAKNIKGMECVEESRNNGFKVPKPRIINKVISRNSVKIIKKDKDNITSTPNIPQNNIKTPNLLGISHTINASNDRSHKLYQNDLLLARTIQAAHCYTKLNIKRVHEERVIMEELSDTFLAILKMQDEIKNEKSKLYKITRHSYLSYIINMITPKLKNIRTIVNITTEHFDDMFKIVNACASYFFIENDNKLVLLDQLHEYVKQIISISDETMNTITLGNNPENVIDLSIIMQNNKLTFNELLEQFKQFIILIEELKNQIVLRNANIVHQTLHKPF